MNHRDTQRDALERAVPQEIETENKLKINTKILPEIKDWKTGESYILREVKVMQISSDKMTDGTIKAEFEVTSIKTK